MSVRRLRIASGGVLLLAALVVGLVTAVLTASWLSSQESETVAVAPDEGLPDETVRVVVVRDDIPAGTTLSAPLLREIEVPVNTALSGAYSSTNRIVGRVTRYPLVSGEQLIEGKLVGSDSETGSGLAFSVPRGQRAISVPFPEVMGAGGLVVPGDRVDIIVHTTYERLFGPGETIPDDDDGGRPIVVTVLQDVLVLAVGQQVAEPADPGRDSATLRSEDAEPQPGARSVTLAVTPAQAQKVFFASQEGRLGLAMRAFGDESVSVLAPEFKLETETGIDGDLQVTR